MNKNKIIIGKILAPHGVRGEVRIKPLTELPERFLTLLELNIEEYGQLKVEQARFHKQFVLVKLAGIEDMNAAEKLRGHNIVMDKADLGNLPEGRYYAFEIEGLEVYDTENNFLGKIIEVLQTGSNDVYIVKNNEGKELLIPALKKVVKNIDLSEGKMLVSLLAWE
ncbi:ribosome maturation factor RimM [Succinispira mobilis]|uniref:ribosome maturation factor RimM n=1 Tax=Succinispira mobilis TaxID=78120 RepID=UPI00036609C1|nr:ribosome maturation factor RimM [Succinispira mobilis]